MKNRSLDKLSPKDIFNLLQHNHYTALALKDYSFSDKNTAEELENIISKNFEMYQKSSRDGYDSFTRDDLKNIIKLKSSLRDIYNQTPLKQLKTYSQNFEIRVNEDPPNPE